MVKTTLQSMRMGGIYDHVGGGFHRYSTDERWLVPHFEKMLYDQAMLAIAYVEAFQATGEEEFARTAREILDYVLRDMTSETGGFFSAEDADSEGEEGKYYLWTADELKSALEKEEMRLMIRLFDVHESGNFERGRNILRLRSAPQEAASVLKMDEKELQNRLEKIRLKLFAVREKRIRPMRDDKILTDWNGLMIAAFARAAQALQEPKYASAAMRSADFLLKEMRTAEWRLLHRYRGEAGIQANLDDYAFLIWGLIDLYETVFDMKYLQAALELNQVMLQHFLDDQQGGLFFTPDEGDAILLRKRSFTMVLCHREIQLPCSICSGWRTSQAILRCKRLQRRSPAQQSARQATGPPATPCFFVLWTLPWDLLLRSSWLETGMTKRYRKCCRP